MPGHAECYDGVPARQADKSSCLGAHGNDRRVGGSRRMQTPLVVAVTGHRDIVPAEVAGIKDSTRRQMTIRNAQFSGRWARAALDEHAEWILMHRERPLEQTKF